MLLGEKDMAGQKPVRFGLGCEDCYIVEMLLL